MAFQAPRCLPLILVFSVRHGNYIGRLGFWLGGWGGDQYRTTACSKGWRRTPSPGGGVPLSLGRRTAHRQPRHRKRRGRAAKGHEAMSEFEVLEVQFHFNGEFVLDESKMSYCNGDCGVSHIEKDKISIPELEGHLLDHTTFPQSVRMYWLPFGAELNSGMRLLVDDKSCLDMIHELGTATTVDTPNQLIWVGMKNLEHKPIVKEQTVQNRDKFVQGDNMLCLEGPTHGQDSPNEEAAEDLEAESDGCDATGFTSDEDDEVREIRTKYKEFMSEVKKRGDIPIDNPIEVDGIQGGDIPLGNNQVLEGGDGAEYFDSDGDASYDEDSDGVFTRRKCRFPIFDSFADTPQFAVDMCFRGKDQLKDAIERYALKKKINIRYVKNEQKRIRAVCRWKGCPWLLYASHNSRSDWFQIVTYNPNHACCPELKNKRLSTRRICDRYESTIKANPSWKAREMKETVQEDMGVDVPITMIKRAKAHVMKKIMDTQTGEYSKLFDYALELQRSNPGTSVHVALDPEEEDHVFQRFYVCFDACRRGFLEGCRRIIGLDGCFLKGPLKGELLSAIGRDANNQLYPIAWAVVEYENKDSWNWFLGHLQKDINIPVGAAGWVFITDQQKNGDAGFEVRDKKWRFTVDLTSKTCSCRYWQVSGIPCQHACAALFKMAQEPNNCIHECFSLERYKKTYQHVLQPVEHESAWPVSPNPKPLPPRVKKMPGRPKKNRRKDPSEPVKSGTKSSKQQEHAESYNPPATNASHSSPLQIEPAQSKQTKGKSIATSSSKSKMPEGSSFIQSGHKRRLVSFGKSAQASAKSSAQASAKASAGGSASVVIETNAGTASSFAKATINGCSTWEHARNLLPVSGPDQQQHKIGKNPCRHAQRMPPPQWSDQIGEETRSE
ncbi:Os08g0432600 [Oryza sativa Japonica Group]|uniref:Os08g0432600 protein n=1 Tax=Oryza sativa subsp. japonica TaxID=39947 RepID=Q0J5I2_ORYSJ|nr:Os08g0432600 [Oryza sativa Japonica Group]|eukprot:NP_001061869.2 Os08g0432600 [Oryza sativa Japonica Group]